MLDRNLLLTTNRSNAPPGSNEKSFSNAKSYLSYSLKLKLKLRFFLNWLDTALPTAVKTKRIKQLRLIDFTKKDLSDIAKEQIVALGECKIAVLGLISEEENKIYNQITNCDKKWRNTNGYFFTIFPNFTLISLRIILEMGSFLQRHIEQNQTV